MTAAFFETYSQLIGLSQDASSETFYSTEDYNKLATLGPTLPKLNYPIPHSLRSQQSEEVTQVTLKSIKPPFKFSTRLEDVSLSTSIYTLKTQLIEAIDSLKEACADPSDLKFMIKSKVLTDSTILSTIAQDSSTDLSITVMVSTPAKRPSNSTQSSSAGDPNQSAPMPMVSSTTWSKIHELLVADLGTKRAEDALSKFKSSI